MKRQWKKPKLETMNFQNTNENIVDCPMDVEASVMKADCPSNNNPNNDIFKFSGLNPIQAKYMNGVIPVTNLEDAFNDLTRYILEAGYVSSSN